MVRVVPIEAPAASRPLGFLAGKGIISADVKQALAADIEAMFGAGR